MGARSKQTYHVGAFAALTGVTVRALQVYDRLGLLTPRRSPSGYRIYTLDDVATLEQIIALKFIGVPLREIKRLLRTDRRDLPACSKHSSSSSKRSGGGWTGPLRRSANH